MVELASILVLGIFAQWVAWKIKMPAIIPLIFIGLLLGPVSTLFTADGEKILNGDRIFKGEILFAFVSLSVGIILFEGGLTLRLQEIKKLASVIWRILTVGVMITLIGGTAAAYYLLDLNIRIAFLFGALIIVSGPTVVMPILRNVRPNASTNAILKWEGILIDPLGALIAVLAYEFVKTTKTQGEFTVLAFKEFFLTIATGVFVGLCGAFLLYYLLSKHRLPEYLRNVVTLGVVVLSFTFSEMVMHESGLLTATIMGMVMANLKIEDLKNILTFKEDISIILTSILFLLLSSLIEIDQINKLGWNSLLLLGVIMLVIRPLGIFLSASGSNLTIKEKLFISWIGPKGIVAAAVASVFSVQLAQVTDFSPEEVEDAAMLLPLVFMVIVGTVVVQGASAKLVASMLGVQMKKRKGVLFIGANKPARFIARLLFENGVPVILADTSRDNVAEAVRQDLPAVEGNVLQEQAWYDLDLTDMGHLMAFTPSTDINLLACQKFAKEFGDRNVYRLISRKELEAKNISLPKNLLFRGAADFQTMERVVNNVEDLKEETFNSGADFEAFLERNADKIIPLILRAPDESFHFISNYPIKAAKGDTLIYLTHPKAAVE
ncbi:sodium:proton antiporter [Cesiribacter sp. SM1]|uniref:cation:proton antiporter n=1 Tax=Cesiribacter sp. SM1 TaxID=2861196 RepID=UPI001CD1A9B5|nr:sodium:proton antiporter [Cesiribacter sp. SM1]